MSNQEEDAVDLEKDADHVRKNTPSRVNAQIEEEMEARVHDCATRSEGEISRRIEELGREWDIERVLETNASSLAAIGVGLTVATGSRKWLILPGIVLPFLLQHAIQGWCPPVPLLRWLGVRTRQEIDREKYALKVLRGDFREIRGEGSSSSRAARALESVRA